MGQENRETSSAEFSPVDSDGALVFLGDDGVAQAQPETGSLTDGFGGEEGIEHLVEVLFSDARAVVFHDEGAAFAIGVTAELNSSIAVDGLAGVEEQVQQNLIDLPHLETSAGQAFDSR